MLTKGLAAALAVVLLAGCNVGDGETPEGDGSGSGAATTGADGEPTPGSRPSPYLPVPDDVVLTDPGSELGLGETATLAWRLGKGEDAEVGVLAAKVRKVVKADIKALKDWQLDLAGRRSSLYYVMVTVANVGDADLGGLRVPLYAMDEGGALVESSGFKTDFDPCPSPALPDEFAKGDKETLCQAYLVPKKGELKAVAFRATPRFNPVTWVGKVTVQKPPKKDDKGE